MEETAGSSHAALHAAVAADSLVRSARGLGNDACSCSAAPTAAPDGAPAAAVVPLRPARASRAGSDDAAAVCYLCCDDDPALGAELAVGTICDCATLAVHVRPCLEKLVNHPTRAAHTTTARLTCTVCLQAYRLPYKLKQRAVPIDFLAHEHARAAAGGAAGGYAWADGEGIAAFRGGRGPGPAAGAPDERATCCASIVVSCRWIVAAFLSVFLVAMALALALSDVSFQIACTVLVSLGILVAATMRALLRRRALAPLPYTDAVARMHARAPSRAQPAGWARLRGALRHVAGVRRARVSAGADEEAHGGDGAARAVGGGHVAQLGARVGAVHQQQHQPPPPPPPHVAWPPAQLPLPAPAPVQEPAVTISFLPHERASKRGTGGRGNVHSAAHAHGAHARKARPASGGAAGARARSAARVAPAHPRSQSQRGERARQADVGAGGGGGGGGGGAVQALSTGMAAQADATNRRMDAE
ncbi:hypothetical protein KFE25_002282 [Diacronema lutheri]|uniref:Uncharacterized protein n=3 Tax=Diacronema lutheri TaxID=2081491 RepID=A0A8J5X745_DIALT|nr:hypothetical protein KFE25_002282 [Diacronema lutheri]